MFPFLHSAVDSVHFVDRTLAIQPNQCYHTTPSQFSTNQSFAQLRHDGTEGNPQEPTPTYAKLDPEYAAIYSRQGSTQPGEKIKLRERYEFLKY